MDWRPISHSLKATMFLAVTPRNLKLVNMYLLSQIIIKIFFKVGRYNIFNLKVISLTSIFETFRFVVLPWACELLEAGLLLDPFQAI